MAAEAVTVRLAGVGKTFAGGVEAVAPLDLTVRAGEFVAMLGPSGCGKSTLLRLIAGLERTTCGTVSLLGGPDSAAAVHGSSRLAYVFQDAHLLPWRNVLSNVTLPLELLGWPAARRREAAAAMLEQVGLADTLHRYPAQLSGGMRMRVSLARALVTRPALLLLDEPFAALDEITRQALDEALRELWRQHGITVIFVTHSIAEATFLAQRAVVFSPRPARVVLDSMIDLPDDRPHAIRATPAFAAQTAAFYDALAQGSTP